MINFINKKTNDDSIQSLIPIKSISSGNIVLQNNKLTILKIEPTNFKLKTSLEQNAILENYKMFLKSCDFNIQIIIQTKKKDMTKHLKKIREESRKEMFLSDMAEDYINFISETMQKSELISREFYIVFETKNEIERITKVKECLKLCDNDVEKCEFEEVRNIFKNYLNRRMLYKNIRKE